MYCRNTIDLNKWNKTNFPIALDVPFIKSQVIGLLLLLLFFLPPVLAEEVIFSVASVCLCVQI